jgi:methyl-accepting chemotaxis protein
MSGTTILLAAVTTISLAGNAFLLLGRRYQRFNRELHDHLQKGSSGRPDLAVTFSTKASAGGIQAEIAGSLNKLIGKLSENFKKTFSVGYQLIKTSDSMKQVSGKLQEMSDKLSSQASAVATAMEEMSSTISEIARNASTAAAAGASSSESAAQAERSIEENVKSIERLSRDIATWAETNRALSEATDRIDKIILVINDIAGQTNLLALNAAIEAARAGEQGRGFAVVADEVRKLADKTATATKEIGDMIKDVKEKADRSLSTMDVTMKQAEENISRSKKAEEALKKIVVEAKQTVDRINQIATASEEQAQVSTEVLGNMEKVSGYASEAGELAKAISASGDSVASYAHNLYSQLCSVKKDGTDDSMEGMLKSCTGTLSSLLETSVQQGRLEHAALFDDQYQPAGEAGKFTTRVCGYFETEVLGLLKKWTGSDKRIVYVVVMDRNGYMPTHVNAARARIRMQDQISLAGAKSDRIVGQAFRRPIAAGGELVVDIAAPLTIGGRHWGCLRIGYLPEVVQ